MSLSPITELLFNVFLMLLCYTYVVAVILVSNRFEEVAHVTRKTSRKFLHIMIGNLPFVIQFFTINSFPGLVAAPFIFLTFLASPYSPSKSAATRMRGLSDITEEGHHLGLVFYAVSYTCLAFMFPSRAYVIAAGILPMAYGDAAASVVGEKYGKRKYKLVAEKAWKGLLRCLRSALPVLRQAWSSARSSTLSRWLRSLLRLLRLQLWPRLLKASRLWALTT